jgi:hypothetical protein
MQIKCLVYAIRLSPHPDPKLMIGQLGEHQVVVGNHYDEGTLGFHIPVGAIVPDEILKDMWLLGKLSGNKKNKVKAREMKGVHSDGLYYGSRYFLNESTGKTYIDSRSWNKDWKVGDDVAGELGIIYEK